MPISFEQISFTKLEGLPREQTVFFFPVGPMEDHGPHLPLGLDGYEATKLSLLAATRLEKDLPGWSGVVMPYLPLGIDSNTTHFSITVRAHVLRDWLVDSCRGLTKEGFRHFVCFSGHLGPRQLTAIEEAGRILRRKSGPGIWRLLRRRSTPTLISASSALVTPKTVFSSALWPDPVEHGGSRDTSIALQLVPNLVDPNYTTLPTITQNPSRWKRTQNRWKRALRGYWGTPADARSEVGLTDLEERIDAIFLKMQAVWEGANPEGLFRSWYSVFPPNKSFFKAWVILAAFGCVMAAWLYVVFQAFVPM